MQSRPGTFIVIEGTDGSGKGTQFELLCDRLRQAGYTVATFDFPQYDAPSSYFVAQYLNGKYGKVNEVGPYTASLFYALDRYEAAPRIKQALADGKVVVSNRFTGSSMGHQGTKFRSPEERRGFFIWLDNLEFEMLQIPRPDISFVLRVPADVAQSLVDKKAPRSYTDAKRDIHEADVAHLEKSVEVYDDLTQLFPKDFQRIDCVRNDKLLDVDSVQNMLWEKITPLLPPPPQLELAMRDVSSAAQVEPAAAITEAVDEPNEPDAPKTDNPEAKKEDATRSATPTAIPAREQHFVVENASSLLAQRLERSRPAVTGPEQPLRSMDYTQKDADGNYRYYVPKDLSALTTQQYHAHMVQIFDLYSEMVEALGQYLAENDSAHPEQANASRPSSLRTQANEILRPVLPTASKATATVQAAAGPALEELVVELLGDALPEVRTIGQGLLRQLPNLAPVLVAHAKLADDLNAALRYRAQTRGAVQKLAREYLPEHHAAVNLPIQLADRWPHNEMDLLPEMLYEHSSLPLAELRQEIAAWPYNRKLDVFESYIGERPSRQQVPGPALEKARYSWDIICEYDIFRELQHHQAAGKPQWQPLTPRYGYAVPKLVEEAGLSDQFERCFDLSLELYSLLQQAGHQQEAQYATLLGHKMRWQASYNAHETFRLHELPATTTPGCRRLIQQMYALLTEAHPLLAEAMNFNSGG